ncbi:MAG TPA: XrtA/PEP-CTERM system exopolysaccharide export protein [Stellaceae bacterium]|nr:XrtA/PEP-CTERM system exopolysaccharide export protein [Stellaceae bacterium]
MSTFRAASLIAMLIVAGCQNLPPPPPPASPQAASEYIIGPGDSLEIFVWRKPDLSVTVPVRPDGRISIPLVPDLVAVGKTTTGLAHEIEQRLQKYVKEPLVTVIAKGFVGPFSRQVRVIGEAASPHAISYRANMTVLDAMIEVGGLTKYAAGNDAVLVRTVDGKQVSYAVHLGSLIRDGDVSANVALAPGDILIIPQRRF